MMGALADFCFLTLMTSALASGLSAGALLSEAGVLVPCWRSGTPEEFLAWYGRHAGVLVRFFGPLEVVTLVAALAGLLAAGLAGSPAFCMAAVSGGMSVGVLLTFPIYFRKVNAGFADASIPLSDVSGELVRWARWHNGRTVLALVAFFAAVSALWLDAARIQP